MFSVESDVELSRTDVERLGHALSTTKSQVYRHASSLVPISVAWVLTSLPIITVGPATVGAYAAIGDVLRDHEVDYGHVLTVLKKQAVAAFVLSILPATSGLATILYFLEFTRTRTLLAGMMAMFSVYATVFLVLVLIPTFVALSEGDWIGTALKRGYLETVSHATLSLTMAFLTLVVFIATLLTTIGFVLLFAAAAFTFHIALFADETRPG